ncbi:DUF7662 domain-containing protein [Polymorphum gilvum]|uniref:DUF7662 domain-containing protein n=1 Tax=Polymorphum gilvum (strain LMG 25793 / CGMCC 1.9160 / SL003B-26A1) TaxID=991905 RepID=F2J135_POLGS|nr:hypothetical protein [Polymorphum gilvum]ADZ71981.1 hypothetical protein SL003B_3559 [Polymorphum gilvum SL003B-26A1]
MGKYTPLRMFLLDQGRETVPMTFSEIERLLGESLPASKQYPAWWSNNPSNNPMTREWLAAGYRTEQVDVTAGKLVFRRALMPEPIDEGATGQRSRNRIFGCMKGTLTVLPGVDLTGSADPEWGKVYGNG